MKLLCKLESTSLNISTNIVLNTLLFAKIQTPKNPIDSRD